MTLRLAALFALALSLSACGGGGGGSHGTDGQEGGQDETSVIAGTTARFASPSLNFGLVTIGQSKTLQTVVHNDGTAQADFSDFDGLPSGVRTSGCDVVPAGGSCTLSVTFRPADIDRMTAVIAPTRAENITNRLQLLGIGMDECGTMPNSVQPNYTNLCP